MCKLVRICLAVLSVVTLSSGTIHASSYRHRQALTASPVSIGYGSVQVGSSLSQAVIVKNSGLRSVTITSASASTGVFQVSGLALPLNLPPGGSASAKVTFAPTSASAYSAYLTFATNSWISAKVSLSGTGAQAVSSNIAASPGSVSFGSVPVGATATVPETLTNSGNSSVTVSQASIAGTGFSMNGLSLPVTLNPGQGVTFSVSFAPPTPSSDTGNLTISSNATQATLNVGLTGTGVAAGALAASPSSVSFGSIQVGQSAAGSLTITNSGGQPVSISQASTTGAGFSVSGLSLPLTLAPAQRFTFGVAFAPLVGGSVTGSVSLTSDASNPTLAIPLSGTGTAPGQLGSTASLSFGSVTISTSKSLSGSLSATGADVTVSGASSSNAEFALSGLTFPLTIPAGQSKAFTVTFAPQTSGSTSGTLSFASNASGSPTTAVSGSGVAAVAHSVDLSWTASSSAVVGYNVYRGAVSGGPYTKINSAADAATAFTDGTVQSGQTYYYTVTAVDNSGTESARSNEVQAVIPTP